MPFMTRGKRDYQKEKAWDHSHDGGQRLKDRAARNKARRVMSKAGKDKVGDGKHVDHKRALTSGGSNVRSNLRITTASANLRKEALRKKR